MNLKKIESSLSKYAHCIKIETTHGHWIAVDASQLTDGQGNGINIDTDPTDINGSYWYLNGDYTAPPMPIRINNKELTTLKKEIIRSVCGALALGVGLCAMLIILLAMGVK